ncbi:MAG TPA: glycosyltransferase family 2 protein [Thermoanaerobaculia bacterium]|nr:glycosyltransferase family 2 protein [Thermoanaerobaculia bacterium]
MSSAAVPTVSAILVTWDSAGYLPRCAEGLRSQTHARMEIVVVDNGSSDGSAELTARLMPDARLIRNDANRGFAAAVNQGIAATAGDYVLLCNPDAFLAPDYVSRLVDALISAGERCGAATGKLLRATGEGIEPTAAIDSAGIRMTRSGRHLDITSDDGESVREVFGVSGAAALYRRSMLNDAAIDGEVFDEDFFSYREDADLAWRARLLGWSALYVPQAVGYHVRRVTPERRGELPPEINMHSVKNRFLLRIKNEGAYLAFRNAPFEIGRDLLVLGSVVTRERTSLPALAWLWDHRRRLLAKRRAVQRRRRIGDRELARWFR